MSVAGLGCADPLCLLCYGRPTGRVHLLSATVAAPDHAVLPTPPRRPAHLMDDGKHGELNRGRNLFEDFSEVAESSGVYTAID